ncbi:MAG: endonuclease III [Armatimonadetes bacterium]|nr:endonuclease III [Armatimonadota bacterium]
MPRESKKAKLERAQEIYKRLEKAYPNATTELRWSNPLELLVATILSAQCTDERVNQVTQELFKKYRTAQDYANANPEEFQEEIRSTGFYRNKTKSIIGAAKMIVEQFGGRVPDNMDDLLKLPGVSRKTANVVLTAGFGVPSGIVVDTHVHRVAIRLGLVPRTEKNPSKVEAQLMQLFEQRQWIQVSHGLVLHGRYVCTARKPRCGDCVLEDVCPKVGVENKAERSSKPRPARGAKGKKKAAREE